MGGRSVTYGYNAAYKLLSETIAGDTVPANNGVLTYTHDSVGNRLTRGSTLAAIPAASHTYDFNDRISGDVFDNNGNTLSSGGVSYGYDFEDRLTSAGAGDQLLRDLRVSRWRQIIDEESSRYARHRATHPIAIAVVSHCHGAVQRRYTHGTQRISQSQLLSGSWATHFYGYDEGGSVRQLTDTAGVVTGAYAYDGFGSVEMGTRSAYRVLRWYSRF